MTNSKERRRYKESMTRMELKQFRGTTLEARDVRFDTVAKDAERLLRDAIDALLNDFREDARMEFEDDELGYNSGHSSSEVSESNLNEDLLAPSGTFRSDINFHAGDDVTLPPFDPHMHASTVRSNKPARTRSGQKGTVTKPLRRKRRQHTDESAFGDHANMPKSCPGGRTSRKHRSTKKNGLAPPPSEGSYDSGPDPSSLDGDPLSLVVIDEEPMPPRKRRKAATSRSRIEENVSGLERRSNQVSVLERMEAFVRANSLIIDDATLSDASKEASTGSRGQRHREHRARRRELASRRISTIDEEVEDAVASFDEDGSRPSQAENSENTGANISTEAFYRRLERKNKAPTARHESKSSMRHLSLLSDSCKALLAKYRALADDCSGIIDDIVNHFKAETSVARIEAAEVFSVLLQLLQQHGSRTLLEVILADALTGTSSLKRHIQLLVFTLRILDCRVHSVLTDDDGLAFNLFGCDNWKTFVEMVILQLMDVVYARVQPAWWGLDDNSLAGIFEKLIPLRDALGNLVPLVETVSRYTLETFQCQSWQKIDGNSDSLFISAVDSQEFKSLLMTGCRSTSSQASGKHTRFFVHCRRTISRATSLYYSSGSVRFDSFNKMIPRCETETLWLLLAFCAEAPAKSANTSKYRWRLLASLFGSTAGVLSKEYFDALAKKEPRLLPEKDHIKQCRLEMIRFGILVSSSALNPLPDSDNFLAKLVQKCLILQIHECRYSDDEGRLEMLCDLDSTDRARITQTWKASHVLDDGRAKRCSGRDLDGSRTQCNGCIVGRMTGLQSMSPMLQSCLDLSFAWIQQTPKKKARRSRLTQSLQNLINDCVDCASKLEASYVQGNNEVVATSTFEEAFAVQGSNAGVLRAATAYREAAARLSLIAAIGGSRDVSVMLTKELRETVSH